MISPTQDDIGRKVVYTGTRYQYGNLGEGVLTGLSASENSVFVRYGTRYGSKLTSLSDLEWVNPPEQKP